MTALIGSDVVASESLRRVFGAFPTGVVALLGRVDGHLHALTVSSFTSVSLEPPLVGFFADNASSTWAKLRHADLFGISVLAEDHGPLARQLAGPADRRLDGVNVREDAGAYYVAGAVARLRVALETESPAGDHSAVLLRVQYIAGPTDAQPLVYHRSGFAALG